VRFLPKEIEFRTGEQERQRQPEIMVMEKGFFNNAFAVTKGGGKKNTWVLPKGAIKDKFSALWGELMSGEKNKGGGIGQSVKSLGKRKKSQVMGVVGLLSVPLSSNWKASPLAGKVLGYWGGGGEGKRGNRITTV